MKEQLKFQVKLTNRSWKLHLKSTICVYKLLIKLSMTIDFCAYSISTLIYGLQLEDHGMMDSLIFLVVLIGHGTVSILQKCWNIMLIRHHFYWNPQRFKVSGIGTQTKAKIMNNPITFFHFLLMLSLMFSKNVRLIGQLRIWELMKVNLKKFPS